MRDNWLIKGQLSNPSFKQGAVVALGMDGTRHLTKIKDTMKFGINVPGNATYALYFILPPDSSFAPEINNQPTYAVLTYENGNLGESETLRLPDTNFYPIIDLGIVDIKGHHAYPAISPCGILDFDNDGILDLVDLDDQNDGLNDVEQKRELEEVTICMRGTQKLQQKNVHLSELLPYLDQGAFVGPCKKY